MSQVTRTHENIETYKLEYIEKLNIENKTPEYIIIWLHGLGADYYDFVPVVTEIKLHTCVKYIFPNAPLLPITVNNGYVMRAWYDIRDTVNFANTVDRQGINLSAQRIEKLIDSVVATGFKSERIILAGFSQGGVIAYIAGIQSKHKLSGILALSCYLPEVSHFMPENGVNQKTPILACHGKEDLIVPYSAGFAAYNELRNLGFNISWISYPMNHGLCSEEIKDISLWLHDRFL
ncbi:MAG: alpha/beta hydrolase [Neisseriaceae bacterium]